MTETITAVNGAVNSFVWGPVMLALLVGSGIFLSVLTGFIQVRKFGRIMKQTIGSLFADRDKNKHGSNLSPFQAVTTALAGTVGTGNVAGVTGAIFVGGPGAVFWMWFAAFFGMVTKYSEILLAMKYRETSEQGTHYGGPMYYISKGLGQKWHWLAMMFAVCGGLACLGIGNLSQSAEISGALNDAFGISKTVTGLVLTAIVSIVILGGVKRIGTITSYLVPFMAAFYILAGLVLIAMRIGEVPAVLMNIITSAFSFQSVEGGFMGVMIMNAMKQGFSRGVFSNEAGLGSAPIAHSASSTEEPVEQAMWGVFEVFIDTIVICSITSLAILLSGVLNVPGGLESFSSKGAAAIAAFNAILPGTIGGTIIEISLIFFALSTILSWSYYGDCCWRYVTNNSDKFSLFFKIVFISMCFIGASGSGALMWDISDTLNGLMAIPNLVALLMLSQVVVSSTKEYFSSHK